MTKALFVVVPVLALVVSSGTAVATHSALAIDEATGVINGAEYAMFVPPAWNGRLILYAHGFVDPGAPIALPDAAPADVAPWVVQLRETLLRAGYAAAYSSYAENGWAVKDGAARTHELRDLFSSRFGAPTHVYVMGRSLGGLITVFLAETFPGAYQGALALCGPLGGGRLETDYIGNVRVLFDYFFPGVIPGDVLHVPEMEYSADSPVVKAIVAAILANPQGAVALASVDQIKLPYTTLGQLVLSIVRPIGYNIRGTNDLLARTGGQSPFDNVGVWYTRLGVVDPFVNAGVGRFAAQAGGLRFLNDYYQTRGTLAIPLLTLHTTLDPDVQRQEWNREGAAGLVIIVEKAEATGLRSEAPDARVHEGIDHPEPRVPDADVAERRLSAGPSQEVVRASNVVADRAHDREDELTQGRVRQLDLVHRRERDRPLRVRQDGRDDGLDHGAVRRILHLRNMEDISRNHARKEVIEEHPDVADVIRLQAAAPERPAQRERALVGPGKGLGQEHGDQPAQRPTHDVDVRRRSEAAAEEITQLVRPRGAVLHRPPVLGVARVSHRVSRAQERVPELDHPC